MVEMAEKAAEAARAKARASNPMTATVVEASKHHRSFSAKSDCSVHPGDGLQFIKRSSEKE
jgi:uncharacterized protein GlcG (DUF336 family)